MFFVFRIAKIATIDVTRIFQNCHNCDFCKIQFGFRDAKLLFLNIFVKISSRSSDSCFRKHISRSSDYVAPAAGRLQIGTLWTQGIKLSSVFEGMCSLGLVEVLDRPNSCFRMFSLKIFRGPRTHVFVKYFTVLRLCDACGGPLTNWNPMDTETQT